MSRGRAVLLNPVIMSNGIPHLSREGTRELLEEMSEPPADTPERRATIERSRRMQKYVDKIMRPETHGRS
jgi:hypothetical protein